MRIAYKKQPVKYLEKIDAKTQIKLLSAINEASIGKGDVRKLKGTDIFRIKIYHYRILFTYDIANDIMVVEEINVRGDVY